MLGQDRRQEPPAGDLGPDVLGGQADRAEIVEGREDDLGVGVGPVLADDVDIPLEELAKPALLRPFRPAQPRHREPLDRPGQAR